MMRCSECGAEEIVMPTVYWPEEGDEAEEWPLCSTCYADAAGDVLIVPGEVYAWGVCRSCSRWFSVRDLTERTGGGGRYNAPSGVCRGCRAC